MNEKIPKISLEQWLAFKTVVDRGSYVLAAETLNKSQSSVSYAIKRLNEQLPKPVLRILGRKAELTNEGEILYRYASQLIKQARTMEDLAQSMAMEFESEITIALDVLLEISALTRPMEQFSNRFPHTRVRVLETSMTGTTEALIENKANIVIGTTVPVGFSGLPIRSVNMIPVATPSHTIFENDEVSEIELKSYRQVVLRDTGLRTQRDAGWLEAEQRWTVSNFFSSISLVKSGLVFGFLPHNWIRQELAQGLLKEIVLGGGYTRSIPLYLMQSVSETSGPATRAMVDLLSEQLKQ